MLQKTSTAYAPWHILESVDKKYATDQSTEDRDPKSWRRRWDRKRQEPQSVWKKAVWSFWQGRLFVR